MNRVVCVCAYVCVDSDRIYVLASLCGKLFFSSKLVDNMWLRRMEAGRDDVTGQTQCKQCVLYLEVD